ncbi:hypothetical protein J2S03_003082 [Alicyclobacillus cycloheptanicus]|uniref:Uncharacterized protein n=1 Tax=Alicyclobacillus cycloheptanicus TaxID=1457 RepID=A0ABT9XLM6_9BACL|nr:hypothetical protein [Alicyclobacillus cycloheptanicus]
MPDHPPYGAFPALGGRERAGRPSHKAPFLPNRRSGAAGPSTLRHLSFLRWPRAGRAAVA